MATQVTNTPLPTVNISARFGSFFAAVGDWFVSYMEHASRADTMRILEDKSDAELAEMGLRRDQIPQYVFRDLYYI